jgi:protein involved in sex pheromone biosynthesis
MNDGYIYWLLHWGKEGFSDTQYLFSDTQYLDTNLDEMLRWARRLRDEGGQVTLRRKRIVPQPPWERVEL